jgi:hypothetical protein
VTIKLFSFWTGSGLGYVERLCLASMLATGHSVDVYSYDTALELPPGIALKLAEDILPHSSTRAIESGNWALTADIFRYAALKKRAGIWVDMDALVVRPLDGMGEYLFGWQDADVINNAVMNLPPDSECLDKLIELSRSRVVVGPHWSLKHKAFQHAMGLVGRQKPIEQLEWGVIGPFALTHYVLASGLRHHCQAVDVFYPVHPNDASDLFLADAATVESRITSSTRAVHLWNDLISELKRSPPPAGSYIAKMCTRLGVESR